MEYILDICASQAEAVNKQLKTPYSCIDLNIPDVIEAGSPIQKALSTGSRDGIVAFVNDAATNKILDAFDKCVWNSADHPWTTLVILTYVFIFDCL